ncbi:hypothetical protein BS47DRAFT_1399398 [Hydnum rufescens UP504]|uniref:Fatty acid desaturase domain-containing protein n=1 Tax=Hydnum rufescens UP504 TaxID=1448309 RepID=A0A9P6AIR1_9AGAM|nr:hypothetical protein BS47DRAFT_1399398 [Hydnum rufescens UP504]
MSIFEDGPEYKARAAKPYEFPKATLKQVHDAVPKELTRRSTIKGIAWALRDALMCASIYQAAKYIDPFVTVLKGRDGLTGAGIFTLGHDAGHGSLSDHQFVNHTIGFIAHTFILAPYFSWRHSHHLHHKASGSMERDENYLPKTRSELKMAPESVMKKADYEEIFGETPFYTLTRMAIMQFLGWQLYLTINALEAQHSHAFPVSAALESIVRPVPEDLLTFIKFYLVPYVLLNHWVVMFTYLHHTDPTLPHFRKDSWTFLRGAVTTIDRPLMGWMGRFFFHNISHDHIAHHFYSSAPFYNGPEITKYVRKALGDEYNYDSTNTFRALYRSFTNCEFVEDDGGIVMWKNREGKAVRKVAGEVDKME